MKGIWIYLFGAVLFTNCVFANLSNTRIAILDFEEKNSKDQERLAVGLADVLEAHLSEAGFDVYERRQIRYVISERGLSRDGVTTIGKDEIAKLKHVTHLIQGRVEKLAGKQVRMNIEVIDTKKGTLLTAIQSEGEFPKGLEQINAKVTAVLKRKLKGQPVSRKSRVVPGFPQSPEGAVYFYRGINAFIKKDYPAAISNFNSGLIINKDDYLHRHWIIKCYEQMGLYVSAGLHSDLLPKGKGGQQEYVSLRQKWSIYGLEHFSSQERANFKRALTAEAHIDIFEPKRITSVLSEKDLKYSGEFEEGVINDDHWLTSDRFLNIKKHEGKLSIEIIDSASGALLAKIQPKKKQERIEFDQIDWKRLGNLALPEGHGSRGLVLEEAHVQTMLKQRFLNYLKGDYSHQEEHAETADHSLIKKWHALIVLKRLNVRHDLIPKLVSQFNETSFYSSYPFYSKKGKFYKKVFAKYISENRHEENVSWCLKKYPKHICSFFMLFNNMIQRSIEKKSVEAVNIGNKLMGLLHEIKNDHEIKVNFYYHYALNLSKLNQLEKARRIVQLAKPYLVKEVKLVLYAFLHVRIIEELDPLDNRMLKWVIKNRSTKRINVKHTFNLKYRRQKSINSEFKVLSNLIMGSQDRVIDSKHGFQLALKNPDKAWRFLFDGLCADIKNNKLQLNNDQWFVIGTLYLLSNKKELNQLRLKVISTVLRRDQLTKSKAYLFTGLVGEAEKLLENLERHNNINIAFDAIQLRALIIYCRKGDLETNRYLNQKLNEFINRFSNGNGKVYEHCFKFLLNCLRFFANTGRSDLTEKYCQLIFSKFNIVDKKKENRPQWDRFAFLYTKGMTRDIASVANFELANCFFATGRVDKAIKMIKQLMKDVDGKDFGFPFMPGNAINFRLVAAKQLKYFRIYSALPGGVYGKREYMERNAPVIPDKWLVAIWLKNQRVNRNTNLARIWIEKAIKRDIEILYRIILSPPEFLNENVGYFSTNKSFTFYFHPVFTGKPMMLQCIFECLSKSYAREIMYIPSYKMFSKETDDFIPAAIVAKEMADGNTSQYLLNHLLDHSELKTEKTTKIMIKLLSHPDEKIRINVGNKIIKSYKLKVKLMKPGGNHMKSANEIKAALTQTE